MTIRDIAIAIGFDVDDGALEKLFDRLSHLRDKKISVQTQATGEDAAIRQAAEEQISDTLRQQDQTMQGILQKEQQINQEGKKVQQQTQKEVQRKRTIRDLLNSIFGKSKQVTNETKKQTEAENKHQKELNQTKATYQQISGVVRSMVGKLTAAFGLGFSLVQLKDISEEFTAVNNQIRSATEGMGEQAEIQQQILKAANNSRTAYGDTAKFVGNLVQSNKDLFGSVDEAAQYAELTNKLFRSAGKSSEQVAEMQEALNQSFARGVVDTETMSRLLEEAPEAVKLLEKEVGASKEQFEEMASAGQITVADLKNAIVNNADEINRAFGNVNMTVSDALLNIRNQWGVWVAKINDQYKITDRLSRLLVTIFGKLMNWLDKAVAFVDKLADKLGGFENLLKLIAIAAGSI